MSKIRKCDWVKKQKKEASSGEVTLRNGKKISIRLAYRCLYCQEYFNQKGAEKHFGKTRKQFISERGIDVSILDIKDDKK